MTDVSIAVTVKTQEVTKSQFPVPDSPLFFSLSLISTLLSTGTRR